MIEHDWTLSDTWRVFLDFCGGPWFGWPVENYRISAAGFRANSGRCGPRCDAWGSRPSESLSSRKVITGKTIVKHLHEIPKFCWAQNSKNPIWFIMVSCVPHIESMNDGTPGTSTAWWHWLSQVCLLNACAVSFSLLIGCCLDGNNVSSLGRMW